MNCYKCPFTYYHCESKGMIQCLFNHDGYQTPNSGCKSDPTPVVKSQNETMDGWHIMEELP
jgi:hypothetical protein